MRCHYRIFLKRAIFEKELTALHVVHSFYLFNRYVFILLTKLMARNLWQPAVWNGGLYIQKNSYYACVLASDYIQQIMASGVRDSSKNSRGLFLQLHNVSSADLLWDEKKSRKRKANVSSDYFAVERLISRRTSHGTVSSQFALVYDICH